MPLLDTDTKGVFVISATFKDDGAIDFDSLDGGVRRMRTRLSYQVTAIC